MCSSTVESPPVVVPEADMAGISHEVKFGVFVMHLVMLLPPESIEELS